MRGRGRSDPGLGFVPPRYPGSFLLAFREAIAVLQWELQRFHRDLAECRDAQGREHCIGLENIYRRARRTPRSEWPNLFADFLQTVVSAEVAENLPNDLSVAADQLMFRLGPPLKLGDGDVRVWRHPLGDTGLVVNLVIDYPNRMCYVSEQLVAASGQTGSNWLDRARANLLARTPADCFQLIHAESGLLACSVGDAYDSSRALLLEEFLPAAKAVGYLTIVPGRDELLVLPITAGALPHIHLLKMLAENNFKSAPYPISDEVYWVHAGQWHRFPITVRTGEVDVQPPAQFLEVVRDMVLPEALQSDSGEDSTPDH